MASIASFTLAAAALLAVPAAAQDCTPLTDAASSKPELSTLLALVEAAGVQDALTGSETPLTLFAPTNDAFAEVGTVEELSSDVRALAEILGNHIVPGAFNAADFVDGETLMSMNPHNITVGVSAATPPVVTLTVPGSEAATVVEADIEVCEGVIHVIDTVLVHDMMSAMAPMAAMDSGNCSTIVETAMMTPALSTLVEAVVAADVVEVLDDEQAELTVFAPNNMAFTDVDGLDALLADQAALGAVLRDHVVVGAFMAADLMDGMTLTTVAGTELTVAIANDVVSIAAPNGGTVATVVLPDVEACESIVHVVDTVLVAGESGSAVDTPNAPMDRSTPAGSSAAGVAMGGAVLLAAATAALF